TRRRGPPLRTGTAPGGRHARRSTAVHRACRPAPGAPGPLPPLPAEGDPSRNGRDTIPGARPVRVAGHHRARALTVLRARALSPRREDDGDRFGRHYGRVHFAPAVDRPNRSGGNPQVVRVRDIPYP